MDSKTISRFVVQLLSNQPLVSPCHPARIRVTQLRRRTETVFQKRGIWKLWHMSRRGGRFSSLLKPQRTARSRSVCFAFAFFCRPQRYAEFPRHMRSNDLDLQAKKAGTINKWTKHFRIPRTNTLIHNWRLYHAACVRTPKFLFLQPVDEELTHFVPHPKRGPLPRLPH